MSVEEFIKMKFKSEQQKAIINLRITSHDIGSRQTKFMSNYGLSMPQFNILRILRGAGEAITVNTVKSRMIEKSPNTTRLLDKLLEKELIKRKPCKADRRQTYVELTDNGANLLTQIDQTSVMFQDLEQVLSDQEAQQLNLLLDKLRNSFPQ